MIHSIMIMKSSFKCNTELYCKGNPPSIQQHSFCHVSRREFTTQTTFEDRIQANHANRTSKILRKFKIQKDIYGKDKTPRERWVCHVCGQAFVTRIALVAHMATHHRINVIQLFLKVDPLNLQVSNSSQRWKCHICGLEFTTRGGFAAHMQAIHGVHGPQWKMKALDPGVQGYECCICGSFFLTRRQLEAHFIAIHN